MYSRPNTTEPLEVLHDGETSESTAAKSSPSQHAASGSSPPSSASSLHRSSFQAHGRTMSTIPSTDPTNAAPRSNRFSLSFPVQLSRTTSPVRSSHSPVRDAPSVIPESLALLTGPTDTNFLTAIAGQERRVLELKEELSRAEAELTRLKRQWAEHEAHKKRDDANRVTRLQPLQTSSIPATEHAEDDTDGSNAWMQQEMERRKALLNSNPASSRTVFSGSRHMRTLSLLSPVGREASSTPSPQKAPARPPRNDSIAGSAQRAKGAEVQDLRASNLPRAITSPDMTADGGGIGKQGISENDSGLDKDMLIRTSKKMATDLRDGFLTFFEDLRQVTVGEEATKVEPPPRRQSSGSNLRAVRRQGSKTSLSSRDSSTATKTSTDSKRPIPTHTKSATASFASTSVSADLSFWNENGVSTDQEATPVKKKKSSPAVRHAKTASKVSSIASSDNDGWDIWDESSPHGSRTSSAASEFNTRPSTVSDAASPRTSSDLSKATELGRRPSTKLIDDNKKDPIPWPALANLGPKALRRTASHLMAEWEKSLNPSPTKEGTEQDDYLGLGAEAAAAAVPVDRRKDQA